MKKKLLIIFTLMLITNFSYASDDKAQQSTQRPTNGEVKKVLDHLYKGQGNGMFLYEVKICKKIEKSVCIGEVDKDSIILGDKLKVWMNFFGPVGDKATINYDFQYKGKTKKANMFNVDGAYRWRTQTSLVTNKLGEWELQIYQEVGDDIIDLGSIKYIVNEVHEDKGLIEQLLGD